MRRVIAYAAFGLMLVAVKVQAADISVFHRTTDAGEALTLVVLIGDILNGDAERFDKAVADLPADNTVIVLESRGGKVIDGLSIGTTIRLRGYATAVLDGSICASACGLIWLAGRDRYAGDTAKIGFHAVYERNGDEAQVSGAGNALVGSYLSKLGLSDEAVFYITEPNPDENLHWLNHEIAARIGIRYIPLDAAASRLPPSIAMTNPPPVLPLPSRIAPPPTAPSQPVAPPAALPAIAPQTGAVPGAPAPISPAPTLPVVAPDLTKDLTTGTVLERQVMHMIVRYFAQWSASGTDLATVAPYYAPMVNFYGGDEPRQKLMAEKQKFAMRWPTRQFVVQTIVATCHDTCSVTGMVAWDVASEARNERSLGTASFRFTVAIDATQTPPRGAITLETGSVTQAHKEPLHTSTVATTVTQAPDAQTASVTPAFAQGRQDRIVYETWYAGLPEGAYRDGASFWAAHRSDRVPPSCSQPGMPQDWQRGCEDNRSRLAVSDLRRKSDKNYWWGWNSL